MKIFKIGCGFFVFGILLFFVCGYLFTYRGDLFPGSVKVSEISLLLWLPMIVFGIILMMLQSIKKDKNK